MPGCQSWEALFDSPGLRMTYGLSSVWFDFAAMERNNLMRLAHTIPFTPVSLLGELHETVFTEKMHWSVIILYIPPCHCCTLKLDWSILFYNEAESNKWTQNIRGAASHFKRIFIYLLILGFDFNVKSVSLLWLCRRRGGVHLHFGGVRSRLHTLQHLLVESERSCGRTAARVGAGSAGWWAAPCSVGTVHLGWGRCAKTRLCLRGQVLPRAGGAHVADTDPQQHHSRSLLKGNTNIYLSGIIYYPSCCHLYPFSWFNLIQFSFIWIALSTMDIVSFA